MAKPNAAQKAKGGSKIAYGASEGAKAGSAFGPYGALFGALGGAIDQGVGDGAVGKYVGFTPYDELGGTGNPGTALTDAFSALKPPEGYDWADVYGEKPKTVKYKATAAPDNFKIWEDNLAQTMKLMGATNELVDATNAGTNKTASNRIDWINTVLPMFRENLNQSSANTNDLLNGKLSNSDARQITREGNDMRSLVGTPGNFGGATARDLGLKQFELQQQGQQNLSQSAQLAEMLNPFAAQVQSRSYQQTPVQAMANAQWNATFKEDNNRYGRDVRQQEANIKAAPNPVASNIFATLAQLTATQMGAQLPAQIAAQNAPASGSVDWGSIIGALGSAYGAYSKNSAQPAQNTGQISGVAPATTYAAPAATTNYYSTK